MTPPADERDAIVSQAEAAPGVPDAASVDALRTLLPGSGTMARVERRNRDPRRALDRRVMAVIEGMSDAFLALGPDWRITYANREAARLDGASPDQMIGDDHWRRWPHTIGSEVERQYRRVVAERVPVQFEHHYEDLGIWHDIRAYPSDDGGIAIFFRDITAAKHLELERERQARELSTVHEKAIAAEAQFRVMVEKVQDYAVFLMDPDGIITTWGEGARRMKRFEPHEIIGKHLRVLYPDDGMAEDGSADEHLREAARSGEYIGEGMRRRGDGELFPARVVLTALRDGDRVIGFSKISQDLSMERERESALAAAMEAARSASVAKSQFLANTSHEIRTPLNAIMGYAELLEMGMGGSLAPAQRGYVERIQTTSRHLLGLINDVLDLSRIEAGHMRTAREPALVCDAVGAAVELVEPQYRTRGIELMNGCRSCELAYRGDAERLRQVLVNLLSNAARFTEPAGRVTVSSGSSTRTPPDLEGRGPGPWTFVRVEDTGLGIPAEHMSRIWDAFEQADASRTRRVGGSGLGLTISRHLARLMGGDITAQSQPGLGSTFMVWLPAIDPAEVPRPPLRADGRSPEERLASAEGVPGMEKLSDALLNEAERVIAAYVERLRGDAATPSAAAASDAQLEDHMATLLADLAQSLTIIGHDGIELEDLMRDGSAIQRLIASRHGEQRARIGWRVTELHREFEILRDEVHAALERRRARGAEHDVARAAGAI
ncbi:MAG TPA: ATP-binding protein, partial [Gemmatimonadaceae bacterium]|nr:ATP-binding protein [Gemmatimonadaceae bacterium]